MITIHQVASDGLTNRFPVKTFTFPGGELQVSIPGFVIVPDSDITITARLKSPADFMELVIVSEIVQRRKGRNRTILIIPYFPYAQQDRVMDPNEAFSLRSVTTIINNLGYDTIVCVDPHSDVTPALVPKMHVTTLLDVVRQFDDLTDAMRGATLVSPDAGSAKKVHAVASHYGMPQIVAAKTRDTKDGRLSDFRVAETVVPDKVVMLDDICVGGATFIELAKVLRDKGAKHISLYVTHGIFSRGLAPFDGLIDRIFTTDSFPGPVQFGAEEARHVSILKLGGTL